MVYKDPERELARELLRKIEDEQNVDLADLVKLVIDNEFCYNQILEQVADFDSDIRKLLLDELLQNKDVPQSWYYYWGMYVGDREIMRDLITDSEWAYKWARDIGDREIMRDRVVESEWAFRWALCIGDQEIMRDRVTDSPWVHEWSKHIDNKRCDVR